MSREWRFCALAAGGALAFLVGFAPMPSQAQNATAGAKPSTLPANPYFAVVDIDRIMRECAAAKSVHAQAEKYAKTMEDERNKEAQSLRSTQQSLEQQRAGMSQDAFSQKAQAFDHHAVEVQNMWAKRGQALDRSFNTAMSKVNQVMIEATREVAQTRGANVVLVKQMVLFFDDRMDITNEIISVMNRKLPTTEFPAPKVEAEADTTGAGAAAASVKPKSSP